MLSDEELRELYQEVILDHQSDPRNFGELAEATHQADGHNPLCGDRVQVSVEIVDDRIKRVKFKGAGCAISTASASMMTEHLEGRPLTEVRHEIGRFRDLVTGKTEDPCSLELGDLQVLAGVREFPARVKCATLAWHTVEAAISKTTQQTCTE
jgi:nitrogen fixation NifU-like protein